MSENRLLKLIDSMSDDMGHADGKAVETAYGEGFKRTLSEALDDHLLDMRCPVGSLKLSPSGRQRARQ